AADGGGRDRSRDTPRCGTRRPRSRSAARPARRRTPGTAARAAAPRRRSPPPCGRSGTRRRARERSGPWTSGSVSGTAPALKSGAGADRTGPWRRRAPGVALALGLAALALALYAPSLGAPFLSDDWLYLHHNPALALPLGRALRRILLEPYYLVGNWSPLHQLWLLGTWRALGDAPAAHRAANALLHAGVALALAAALRRSGVGRRAAVGAAVLLLVHPVAVEAVAWINQSKTLLGVGLSLLALERWLAHLRAPGRGRLAAATLAGVGALLAKPAA